VTVLVLSQPAKFVLMCSCADQRSYSEAIEFLYSTNAFSITTVRDEVSTVDYLSYYFLPQRLNQIRELRIHWVLSGIPFWSRDNLSPMPVESWARSWNALSRMTGLRRLHINLEHPHFHWTDDINEGWTERGPKLLEQAKTITAPRDFVIFLPNRRCTTNLDVGDSHCVLRFREDDPLTP
jgi:hypothetical protein